MTLETHALSMRCTVIIGAGFPRHSIELAYTISNCTVFSQCYHPQCFINMYTQHEKRVERPQERNVSISCLDKQTTSLTRTYFWTIFVCQCLSKNVHWKRQLPWVNLNMRIHKA